MPIHSNNIVGITGPSLNGRLAGHCYFLVKTMGMLADDDYHGEAGSIDLPNKYLGGVDNGVATMLIQRRRKGLVQAQYETANCCFKQFNCLSKIFRHDVTKHSYCFCAVVVMTQNGIDFGEFIWELPFKYHIGFFCPCIQHKNY